MVYNAICGRLLLAIACAASCGVMKPEPCAMEYLSVPIICTVLKKRPIPPIAINTTETVISNPHGKVFGVLFLFIFLQNVEAWHPLPGAPLRFRLRFVASLRLRLGAGSGLPSAALFDLFGFHG